MKTALFLFTLLFSFDAETQRLELKFKPSFHNYSKCIIYCVDDTCKIQLDIFRFRDTTTVISSEVKLIPYETFKQLKELAKSEEIIASYDMVLDGIGIEVKYSDDIDIKSFRFSSPDKGTKQYELVNMALSSLRELMQDKSSKKYLRALKKYLRTERFLFFFYR